MVLTLIVSHSREAKIIVMFSPRKPTMLFEAVAELLAGYGGALVARHLDRCLTLTHPDKAG